MNNNNYDDYIFGDECYDVPQERVIIKDNSVNKIKKKGDGKTKVKGKVSKTDIPEEEEPAKVRLTKEEILGLKMAEKKRQKEEAIAKSKIGVLQKAAEEKAAAEKAALEEAFAKEKIKLAEIQAAAEKAAIDAASAAASAKKAASIEILKAAANGDWVAAAAAATAAATQKIAADKAAAAADENDDNGDWETNDY